MPQDVDRALEIAFICPLPSGIHARPASYLADVANRFASDCSLTNERSGSMANAKSVLAIIAADIRHGDECRIRIHGIDEDAALGAMRRFIERDLPVCDEPAPEIVSNGAGGVLPRRSMPSSPNFRGESRDRPVTTRVPAGSSIPVMISTAQRTA